MIVIIGGGAAGLACARTLHAAGAAFTLLEAADHLGGRLRTDVFEGFRLDHGFQIFLTSYPEAQRLLAYDRLQLASFRSGARIREGARWHVLLNPWREGVRGLSAAFAPIGSVGDKVRLVRLAAELAAAPNDDALFRTPAVTALQYLRDYGFSERIINLLFRPFFGGVFLDRDLTTSSNLLRFTFRQFLRTEAALPADGLQAVATELARPLPAAHLRLGARVAHLQGTDVHLTSGEVLRATAVVVATDPLTAAALVPEVPVPAAWRATTVAYYAAPASPQAADRLLSLNPDRRGLLHNVAVPSDVQPTYAPAGQALVSVSSHGPEALGLTDRELDQRLRRELANWYGDTAVQRWRWLRAYRLPHALPAYLPTAPPPPAVSTPVRPGVWVAGDHTTYPSLNGALGAGRRVAEALLGLSS